MAESTVASEASRIYAVLFNHQPDILHELNFLDAEFKVSSLLPTTVDGRSLREFRTSSRFEPHLMISFRGLPPVLLRIDRDECKLTSYFCANFQPLLF